jgi:Protein of unknown function (DUF4056)
MVRPQQAGRVLFCLLVIGWGSGLAQARFLTPREAKKTPRARIACVPSPTMGVRYLDADDLGRHGYRPCRKEGNGIVYTCRGGHIDVTHLRKLADWTARLACQTRDALVRGDREFKFKMFEPSEHRVQLQYPPGWKYLGPETRRDIASKVSVSLGAYLAYTCSVWHEILTWHGFKAIGFYPEYNSAFSWEDNYSNALGSYLGAMALQDRDHDYSEAMTRLINEEFQRLGPQPKETAEAAGQAVKGSWFVGAFIRVTMTKRHLDVGLDDGFVTPWLVPDVTECGTPEPWLCPVPNLSLLEEYGFRIHHEIRPKEWERREILRAVYPNRKDRKNLIVPTEHFGILIEHVKAQANRRYGPYAHLREDPSPAPLQPQMAQTPGRQAAPSDANGPGSRLGSTDVTDESSRASAASFEPSQDAATDEPGRGLFEFLGSAVSWLTQ